MIIRTYDASLIAPAIKHFLKTEEQVDPIEWISNPDNIVLVDEYGNMALFEIGIRHIYSGHYYFEQRGSKAIKAARAFLDHLFNTCYNIEVLLGLTPLHHLGARWMSRQVGFKSYGVVHYTNDKPYEMFIITKKEFNGQ